MYTKLKELNLETYLINVCGGSLHKDSYLEGLEFFLSTLSIENFKILINKFRGVSNEQANDMLHEVAVAYLFHPKAKFNQDNGADLIDINGTKIEIKTLNESKHERERHKLTGPQIYQSRMLSEDEELVERVEILRAISTKVQYHLKRAKSQVGENGIIYLIWDYDFLLYGEDQQIHPPTIKRREIEDQINLEITKFVNQELNLIIRNYFFGDLQNLVGARYTNIK